MKDVQNAATAGGRQTHLNGLNLDEKGPCYSCATSVGGPSMCKSNGCYLKWDATDFCPRCSRKRRATERRERKQLDATPGEQQKLFGGSPRQQLRWWRNRK